jgi:2-polyprenyl-6-hydroxyphenyl methylase/3-demethylubiquinone-9 3-methyltransferase
MTDISIWGYSMPQSWLSQDEARYLIGLPQALPTVEWVWGEMDRVWQQFGLNNRTTPDHQPIGDFYKHPVWLMNGVFTALDPVSASHREAIARRLATSGAKFIADYGGGFGQLALAITRAVPGAKVSIIEPYPSRAGIEQLQSEPRIQFVSNISAESYDAIVAQDVLEHVADPIRLAGEIAGGVRKGGIVIFANCFYPVIHCHLPSTFHLRHTFPIVMNALGLRYVGRVDGASHAQVFERTGHLDLGSARGAERISRILGPVLNLAYDSMSRVKRWGRR